jgi:pyruvate-ferredoxin/flavodoxin oxidoreductase
LGNRTNTILQSAFFRITEVIPVDLAVEQMKKFIVKSYGKKGEDVVNKNYAAVDRGGEYKQLPLIRLGLIWLMTQPTTTTIQHSSTK